ncbi:MAG: hypothetical protein HRO68_04515 [Nitrosopumilus sp.]|nr:hypothetical protein [Nitrosopumilus sp.]
MEKNSTIPTDHQSPPLNQVITFGFDKSDVVKVNADPTLAFDRHMKIGHQLGDLALIDPNKIVVGVLLSSQHMTEMILGMLMTVVN